MIIASKAYVVKKISNNHGFKRVMPTIKTNKDANVLKIVNVSNGVSAPLNAYVEAVENNIKDSEDKLSRSQTAEQHPQGTDAHTQDRTYFEERQ